MANKRVDKGVAGMDFLVCRNPKATYRYEIEERFEAGMVLQGSEVKSLRAKHGSLDGSYCGMLRGELYLHKMFVPPYAQAGPFSHEERRSRKLLLHKHEIARVQGKLEAKGYALIPLQAYFKNGVAKVQIGLGRGKKKGDDRAQLKQQADLKEARAAVERHKKQWTRG